jgi:membrane-associated PAP2 superfamily phosphatase
MPAAIVEPAHTASPWLAGDLAPLLIGLVLLALWDASGANLAVMRLFGDAHGFVWRDHWLTSRVMHDGGRWLGWVGTLGLALNVVWPLPVLGDMPRDERLCWLLVTLSCAGLISLIRNASKLSCPWYLAEFGGLAHPISHWSIAAWHGGDGGPGRCFPSGHASTAFSFLSGWFALRARSPGAARFWLGGVLVIALAFGVIQTMRGAHYPSHSMWTGWICWLFCALARRIVPPRQAV